MLDPQVLLRQGCNNIRCGHWASVLKALLDYTWKILGLIQTIIYVRHCITLLGVGTWVLVLQLDFIGGSHILLSPLSNGGGIGVYPKGFLSFFTFPRIIELEPWWSSPSYQVNLMNLSVHIAWTKDIWTHWHYICRLLSSYNRYELVLVVQISCLLGTPMNYCSAAWLTRYNLTL